jgi:uncharacterized SAM-binding protein YcdF (DUF218 family)
MADGTTPGRDASRRRQRPESDGHRQPPRRRRGWAGVAALSLALLGLLALWPFAFPTSDEPFDDGPVVALGGNEARVTRAADLVEGASNPRVLVLSAGSIDAGRMLGIDCDPPRVRCVDPQPSNTFGEAVMVDAMVAEHGWEQVTVVTDPFHLTRSRLLFRRCLEVPVRLVATETDAPFPGGRLPRAVRELTSAAASFVVQRDC